MELLYVYKHSVNLGKSLNIQIDNHILILLNRVPNPVLSFL